MRFGDLDSSAMEGSSDMFDVAFVADGGISRGSDAVFAGVV